MIVKYIEKENLFKYSEFSVMLNDLCLGLEVL